jgi:hypothetical protein
VDGILNKMTYIRSIIPPLEKGGRGDLNRIRDDYLQKRGLKKVLRFYDREVLSQTDAVMEKI